METNKNLYGIRKKSIESLKKTIEVTRKPPVNKFKKQKSKKQNKKAIDPEV